MEKQEKHIMASLLLDFGLYQSLRKRISNAFLTRLSADYLPFYNDSGHELNEEETVGYEAAWVAVARKVTKNSRNSVSNISVKTGDFTRSE